MAKVQYAAPFTGITGSIGGWTFQLNKSGPIARLRSGTLKNSTTKQTAAHQDLINKLQRWQGLSQANKNLWNTFADTYTRTDRYGTVTTLTGLNWFTSINYYRLLLGLSVLNSPPAHALPTAVQNYNFAVSSSNILLNFSPAFNPADNALLIFTTPFNTRITTSQRQQMRLTKSIVSGPFGFINLTADWEITHAIPWPPSAAPICGRVAIMIQTINKNSGISSTGLIKTNGITTGQEGIGYMAIGVDFIVS